MVLKRISKSSMEKLFCCVLIIMAAALFMTTEPATAWGYNKLTVNVSPSDGGNVVSPQFTSNPTAYPFNSTCSVSYNLQAVPATDYVFVKWNVNASTETRNPFTLSVADEAKSVTAVFQRADANNSPPTADAGDNVTAIESTQVILDGSNSSDPDNDMLTFLWEQIAGSPPVALSSPSAVSPIFTAPEVSTSTTLTFQLTVTDVFGASSTDTMTVTVTDSGNDPPVVDAGDDQTVTKGTEVTLDASGSFDPNNNITSYSWTQTSGTDVTLTDPSAIKPKFTAPDVATGTLTLVFTLTVADATGATDEDTVTITVTRGQIGGTSSSAGCFITEAAK